MTNLLPRLANLPAVRVAAEEQARAAYDAWSNVVGLGSQWGCIHSVTRENHTSAHLSRLLDPLNPAAEGVLADLYRRVTGRETAHAIPSADGVEWHIAYFGPLTPAFKRLLIWNVCGSHAPTRYEAWGRALVAHFDLAAQTANGSAG